MYTSLLTPPASTATLGSGPDPAHRPDPNSPSTASGASVPSSLMLPSFQTANVGDSKLPAMPGDSITRAQGSDASPIADYNRAIIAAWHATPQNPVAPSATLRVSSSQVPAAKASGGTTSAEQAPAPNALERAWEWTKNQAAAAGKAIGAFDGAHARVLTRAAGAAQAAGGVAGAAVAGVGGGASATGVGAASGIPAMLAGVALDGVAGLRTVWTGDFHHTLSSQAAGAGARALGASEQTADRNTSGVDLAQGLVGGSASVAVGIVRKGAGGAAELCRTGTLGRTFTSGDPLVGNLANVIEAAYPGHVVGVNVPIKNSAGQLVTNADIKLQNSIIQVKSGGGKGLASQLKRTEDATGLPTIGYGPSLKSSIVKSVQQSGGLVTKDKNLLIEVVKP